MTKQSTGNSQYTSTQVDQYLARIGFPIDKWPKVTLANASTEAGLTYLTKLQKYQISKVPFENLSLHYSKFPGLSLDKEDIFEKIVAKRKGGYCMELNYLFATILKTLGYEVIQTGARVYNPWNYSPPWGEPGGWGHQVNLVQIAHIVYAVDVAFGGSCMTRPLPLIDGKVWKWGATNAEMRLRYEKPKTSFTQGLWVYEHRNSDLDIWKPLYSFGMTEFTQKDFEIMSFAISTRRTSFFTRLIMCNLMLYDEEVDDIVGTIHIMDKMLKKRVQAQSEILAEFSSEEERIKRLETHFGVVISDWERAGITGTVAEIK